MILADLSISQMPTYEERIGEWPATLADPVADLRGREGWQFLGAACFGSGGDPLC
jgi:hypothetical protein